MQYQAGDPVSYTINGLVWVPGIVQGQSGDQYLIDGTLVNPDQIQPTDETVMRHTQVPEEESLMVFPNANEELDSEDDQTFEDD